MPRNKTSADRHAKYPKSRKSVPLICSVSACKHDCWTKTYGGEVFTSAYCEKHSCEPRPELGVCLARKRSKDAFCHEHSTCQFPNCKKPIDVQYGPYSSCCPYHKCRVQDCPEPIADPIIPFCSHHDPSIFYNLHYSHFLRSSIEYARSPSPPRHLEEEKVENTTKKLEEISPPVTPVAAIAADAGDKTCTCNRDATPVEIKPPQVTYTVEPKTEVKIASNVEPKTESKVEQKVEPNIEPSVKDADHVTEDGKDEERDENEKLPTFFSGVAVGICLLMQIFYVCLQLLLEMARSTAKWRA